MVKINLILMLGFTLLAHDSLYAPPKRKPIAPKKEKKEPTAAYLATPKPHRAAAPHIDGTGDLRNTRHKIEARFKRIDWKRERERRARLALKTQSLPSITEDPVE